MSTGPPVVLITGCSEGGIGYALCKMYASKGCVVYATARRLESMDSLDEPNIHKLVLDVLDEDNANAVVEKIVDAQGRIDILVNNAGGLSAGPMIEVPTEQVRRAFETNVISVLRMSRLVFPHMAQRRSGTLINIGSVVGLIPTPWNGIYAATKAAIHSISETLWVECKPFNINVVLVAPGGIQSNIAKNETSVFRLPENSLYGKFLPNIIDRINSSQAPGSMPADEFARQVVQKTLVKNPPRYMTLGSNSTVFAILNWLPRMWALWFFWKRFTKVYRR